MPGVSHGGSILFVDDEQAIRQLFGKALVGAGFDFYEAMDGKRAVAMLEERTYDALVIDIIMPDQEGVETIIEVRNRWPELFIIAISGGGRIGAADFLELAAMVGADRTLTKPFTAEQLLSALAAGPPPRAAR